MHLEEPLPQPVRQRDVTAGIGGILVLRVHGLDPK